MIKIERDEMYAVAFKTIMPGSESPTAAAPIVRGILHTPGLLYMWVTLYLQATKRKQTDKYSLD